MTLSIQLTDKLYVIDFIFSWSWVWVILKSRFQLAHRYVIKHTSVNVFCFILTLVERHPKQKAVIAKSIKNLKLVWLSFQNQKSEFKQQDKPRSGWTKEIEHLTSINRPPRENWKQWGKCYGFLAFFHRMSLLARHQNKSFHWGIGWELSTWMGCFISSMLLIRHGSNRFSLSSSLSLSLTEKHRNLKKVTKVVQLLQEKRQKVIDSNEEYFGDWSLVLFL